MMLMRLTVFVLCLIQNYEEQTDEQTDGRTNRKGRTKQGLYACPSGSITSNLVESCTAFLNILLTKSKH